MTSLTLRDKVRLSYAETVVFALMVSSSECFALYFAVKQGLAPIQIALLATLPIQSASR